MVWWGKVIGGALGFVAGGGPLGALLGAALGHQFDKGDADTEPANAEDIQAAFFAASFSVMGHVAKADGRISKDEIQAAEAVMAHMRLDADKRRAAIALFREGKASGFDMDGVLDQFRRVCGRRIDLMRMFLEIQFHAAYADGRMQTVERRILEHITRRLGIAPGDARRIEALIQGHYGIGGEDSRTATGNRLDAAYEILGIRPDVDGNALKRAYRRLMNQHHPDKLVARGMPEEMVQLATQKSQEIREAYETIKKARGLR